MSHSKQPTKAVIRVIFIIVFVIFACISLVAIGAGLFIYNNPQVAIERLEYLIPTVTPDPVRIKGVAVLGDSQSDEYRADDWRGANYPSTTRNWVELLAQSKKMYFGEWGSREEPRRDGFDYNWARSGATVGDLVKEGQHTGAAEQIKEGKVNVVIMYVGALDFAPYRSENYESIYNGNLSNAAKKSIVHHVMADIKTVVYTLKDAGDVRILLVKIPDWGNHLGVKIAFPLPQQRILVTEVVNETNEEIEKFAQQENLLTLDSNAFYKNLFRKGDKREFIVDGIPMETLQLNNNPNNFYLEDGVHTGTVVNGYFANAVIERLNTVLINKIKPFSEKEIREAAGL